MPWHEALLSESDPGDAAGDLDLGPPPQAARVFRTRPAPSSREHCCDSAGDVVDGDRVGAIAVGAVLGNRQGVQSDYVERVVDAFASGYDGIRDGRWCLPRDCWNRPAGIGMCRALDP